MYLLGAKAGSWQQEALRIQIERGFLKLCLPAEADALRACALMRTYADAPMDFADASLVVAAETLNVRRILTLDAHFYAYRIHGRIPFEVLP
jgi:predicted nucleic acid-binding protein